MKRRLLFILAVTLIIIGLFIITRLAQSALAPQGRGALQVTTNIKAKVFLDGNEIGDAPLCKCTQTDTLEADDYEIKIVPEDNSLKEFTAKITIESGVLTAVERTFLPGSLSSAYILTLEKIESKNAELSVASIPDGALVTIDGNASGVTPLQVSNISASEHEVEVQKQGFGKKTIKIRTVPSYRLLVSVILGTEIESEQEEADNSPTPSPSTSPTPEAETASQVEISSTPNGFLRVRQSPSTTAPEVTRVNDGETFPLVDEQTGWYQIRLANGTEGWISSTYAQKIEED